MHLLKQRRGDVENTLASKVVESGLVNQILKLVDYCYERI